MYYESQSWLLERGGHCTDLHGCLAACSCPSSSSVRCMTGAEGAQGNSCATLDYRFHVPHCLPLYHARRQAQKQRSYIITRLSLRSSEERGDRTRGRASLGYSTHTLTRSHALAFSQGGKNMHRWDNFDPFHTLLVKISYKCALKRSSWW